MSILRGAALVGVLLAGPPPAGDPAEARARVDKAVAALGGADKLAKAPAATWKAKGTYYGAAVKGGLPFEVVGARQGAERLAVAVEATSPGASFTRALVVDGDKGWLKLNDAVRPLSKAELAEERERMYAGWVATLAPLRGKGFRLT